MENTSPSQHPGRLTPVLVWIARLILAGLFIYAGASKLDNPADFHIDVLNFQWTDDPWAAGIALWLPVLEVLCGVAIIIPSWSRAAALVLAGLLMVFIIALIRAWLLGLNINCGCFGSSPAPVNYPWKLAQNTALLLLALALALALAVCGVRWTWREKSQGRS